MLLIGSAPHSCCLASGVLAFIVYEYVDRFAEYLYGFIVPTLWTSLRSQPRYGTASDGRHVIFSLSLSRTAPVTCVFSTTLPLLVVALSGTWM